MAKKTRTELSTLAINTNLPDNTTELITPTTERAQLTDERESVVNYKDDLGGVSNAGKFITVATDGESLTMVDEPTGELSGSGDAARLAFWSAAKVLTYDDYLSWNTSTDTLNAFIVNATSKLIAAIINSPEGNSITLSTQPTGGTLTPRLTISNGGDVGIGITPTSKLTLLGTSTAASNTPSDAIVDIKGTSTAHLLMGVSNVSPYGAWINTDSTTQPLVLMGTGGNVGIGFAGYGNYKIAIRGASATSSDYAFRTENSGTVGLLQVRNDGYVQTGDASQSPYYKTTANAANLFVGSDGGLSRSTASSKRFKDNIAEWNESGLNTILALKPKTFNYKEEHYSQPNRQFLGLIAEEVADVSSYLADYENEDGSGQIENVRYANIVVPLIKAMQEQQTIIEDLKARIEKLEL